MNLKSKILSAGLATIIAGGTIFGANCALAQTDGAQQTDPAIAQMMQMIEALKQQIQQIIALIAQLKPQETCGNGACRFGETAATCPADCSTQEICGNGIIEHNESIDSCPIDWENQNSCYGENSILSPEEKCCAGLTAYLFNGREEEKDGTCVQNQKLWDNGYSFYKCINCGDGKCNSAIKENICNSPADCAISTTNCAKEGEIAYWNTSVSNVNRCCNGLSAILDCASSANCSKSANSVCTYCGNGTCGTGENSYNCPVDCQNTTSGENCNYKTYAGTCLKTGTSADGISYTFTPFQTPDISGTFLTSASQINPYRGITDTWQIANLTQTSCELKVIASGTCTPIIMRLVLSFD